MHSTTQHERVQYAPLPLQDCLRQGTGYDRDVHASATTLHQGTRHITESAFVDVAAIYGAGGRGFSRDGGNFPNLNEIL